VIDDFVRIPNRLKENLSLSFETGFLSFKSEEVSSDNSVKYLFQTLDGRRFETVYLPDEKRHTVCVSTQSGCRMGCPFCISGQFGFHGNLTAGEIVNQILSIPFANKITHVVFMGMGEPLDNIDNVLKACEIITAQWGLSLSPRNITVSTVGIYSGVERYLNESNCNMTFSLYSPFHKERIKVIPAEKKYPAELIIRLMKDSIIGKGRRLTVAYVMIDSVNDSDNHLNELINLLKDSKVKINLLSYHPVPGDTFKASLPERMQYFKHNLVISGVSASIRKSRGEDISAACGLLAAGSGRLS